MLARRQTAVGVVLIVAFVCLVLALRTPAQPVLSASCVPNDESPGWRYANFYLNRVVHPPVHWQYPNIRLTWTAVPNAEGYYIEADDPYTAAKFSVWDDPVGWLTYTKMPMYVKVGSATTSIALPNLASQSRHWRVQPIIGGVIQPPPAGMEAIIVCGMRATRIDTDLTVHFISADNQATLAEVQTHLSSPPWIASDPTAAEIAEHGFAARYPLLVDPNVLELPTATPTATATG